MGGPASRAVIVVAATFAFVSANLAAAVAASQLNAIRVSAMRGGGTRVFLVLGGGIPQGWHVAGTGTTAVTVILPNTGLAPALNPSVGGLNAVAGVSATSVANEVDVAIALSAPVQISSAASGNTIAIDVPPGPSAAVPGPPTSAFPTPPPSSAAQRTYEVVPLKYADVSEVVGILTDNSQVPPNDIFQPQGSIFSLPTTVGGGGAGQPQPVFNQPQQPQSFGQKISDNISIDRRLNAVILSGTPAEIAALKQIIAKIDVPLPSVMLECEVVELSETAARDLGLDITQGGPGTPVVTGGVSVQTGTATTQGGLTASAALLARLFATIQHGNGKILATPRVLAPNGEPAQILDGDALPILQTTVFPGSPPVTQTTTNYIAVGVNLQIQPRITIDGFITTHVFAEVSSVTAFVQTTQGAVPQISLRQATTTATVADGQPFVIGGLLRDEEIQNMSKIPILGDLPILGGLFRVRHDTITRSNLYIFVTPRIIATAGQNNPGNIHGKLPRPNVPGPTPQPAASPQPR